MHVFVCACFDYQIIRTPLFFSLNASVFFFVQLRVSWMYVHLFIDVFCVSVFDYLMLYHDDFNYLEYEDWVGSLYSCFGSRYFMCIWFVFSEYHVSFFWMLRLLLEYLYSIMRLYVHFFIGRIRKTMIVYVWSKLQKNVQTV